MKYINIARMTYQSNIRSSNMIHGTSTIFGNQNFFRKKEIRKVVTMVTRPSFVFT